MRVDITGRKIKAVKLGGVTVLVLLLLFAALGPGKWQYRTGLGWQADHLVGYFVFTLGFWLAWPRAFVVGGVLVVLVFSWRLCKLLLRIGIAIFRARYTAQLGRWRQLSG